MTTLVDVATGKYDAEVRAVAAESERTNARTVAELELALVGLCK